MYITMADCTRVSSHLPVIQKCCNNLSSKWEAQTSLFIYPIHIISIIFIYIDKSIHHSLNHSVNISQ